LAHLKNPIHIFIGLDWGMLYTMLPIAAGLGWLLLFNPFKISRLGILDRIIYFTIISIPFHIVLSWQHQASYYGYRYLLSLLPFSCIGLAGFLKYVRSRLAYNANVRKLLIWACISAILLFNFLIMLPFEKSSGTILEKGATPMGGYAPYINNKYVINAAKFYLESSLREKLNIFWSGFGTTYVYGFERRVASIYPLIVILLIITSFIILRRKL